MSQVAARSAAHALLPVPSDPTRVGHDWLGTLEGVPLFEGLSKRHLRRIAKLAHIRRFAPGSVIVRAGDAGRSFYVLLDGSAKVNRAGRRSLRLNAGAFFGEMALIDDSPRSADVVAEGEVLALTIDRSGFAKLLRAEPALAQALLRTLAARLRAVEAAL
jgi:CRP/FNR family transcriptional regulator, cyclic AMP receptor protein